MPIWLALMTLMKIDEYAQRICLPIFVVEDFSGLFLQLYISFIKDSRST